MRKKIILILFFISPLIILGGVGLKFFSLYTDQYQGEEVQFIIKNGEGFSSVNGRLQSQKLISSARFFHYYAKYTDKMNKLKVGTYKIQSGMTMPEILELLTSGVGELIRVTIPEGKNMYEVGEILEENNVTTKESFLQEARNTEIINELNIDAPSLEGYLFPETYFFAPNTPAKQVIMTMLKQFHNATKDIDLSQTNLSAHEVVILASIVEKETGAKWERPTIAGVYLNRLKKRMRLQADPTTIYGIWENYNGNLKRKHLLEKTPYNTYKISGLPLGPIANPSLAAIKAVLEPLEHNYIYFVSKNDGTHVFTPTYKEHLKAVDYWQRNRSRRQGKSWRDLKQ